MYCPSCGQSIPEGSEYCLHCGKPVSPLSKPRFSDESPQDIGEVGMYKDVPTKKNWRGKVSHGFRFWFSLLDKSHRPTRSDGRLRIKVTRKVIGAFISRRAFVYEATIEVHKEKFRQSKNDPNFLGFIFNIEEPILA